MAESNRKNPAAVLIGCSAVADATRGIVPRTKADDSTKGNLLGTVADVANMYSVCMNAWDCDVLANFSSVKPRDTNRTAVMDAIEEAFRTRSYVVLYYSGHGRAGDGAWCFENEDGEVEYITPREIAELKSRYGTCVCVISDSCFSGHWAEENFAAQCACRKNEMSLDGKHGGVFTTRFAKFQYASSHYAVNKSNLGWGNVVNPLMIVSLAVSTITTPFVAAYHTLSANFTPIAKNSKGKSMSSWKVGSMFVNCSSTWTLMNFDCNISAGRI